MTYTRETERRNERISLEGKVKHSVRRTQSRQDLLQGMLSRQAQCWTLSDPGVDWILRSFFPWGSLFTHGARVGKERQE